MNRQNGVGKRVAEARTTTESASNGRNIQWQQQAREIERSKAIFANELKRGLRILRYAGQCKCGLMLTRRDRNRKGTYTCPHCGASGRVTRVA